MSAGACSKGIGTDIEQSILFIIYKCLKLSAAVAQWFRILEGAMEE